MPSMNASQTLNHRPSAVSLGVGSPGAGDACSHSEAQQLLLCRHHRYTTTKPMVLDTRLIQFYATHSYCWLAVSHLLEYVGNQTIVIAVGALEQLISQSSAQQDLFRDD